MLVDEFLPTCDIADAVPTLVQADREITWGALMEVALVEVAAASR